MEHSCGRSTCSVCGLVPLAPTPRGPGARVVAESPAMQELLKRAARFAPSDAPVAILGETGTGKEIVARTLHANSRRARADFVAVNVAALPPTLLESELFGHGKGAFTGASAARAGLFEEAHGGTLFLDEIGELPPTLQVKLLRALQDGEVRRVGETRAFSVDVRIVCATHRDLGEAVRRGEFREDLYFRLKVLALQVPPLRARRDDILPLANHFLGEQRRPVRGFARDAKARLLAYPWPGNVRELQNAVQHGAALASGAEVTAADLPEEIGGAEAPRGRSSTSTTPKKPDKPSALGTPDRLGPLRSLAEVEREHILRVLDACGGAQQRAAEILGIGRNTLWRKLRSYGQAGADEARS